MNSLEAQSANIVVTQFGLYQHWSIISDQVCTISKNRLISATKSTGEVEKKPWAKITQGKRTYPIELNSNNPVLDILLDAGSQIELWAYSVTDKNCAHFVKIGI